ncbi:TetR family transcriptional regulator [Nocardia sp. NPDC046473]|uniref:TetR family transcriptional regulator n=1 Tax=Nocardia sp. NPDC046473 TaxID=3155733 RepID=UPI0033E7B960
MTQVTETGVPIVTAGAEVGGLRARKKARLREELITIALRLFEQQGFEETSVQQIADTAQVTRRTFHRYFPSKKYVVFGHEEGVMAEVFAALERRPVGESALTALRGALRDYLLDPDAASERQHQADTARRARQLLHANPTLRGENFALAMTREQALAQRFAARAGLPADDLGPQLLAACCFAGLGVAQDHWMRGTDHSLAALHQALDHTLAIMQDGIDIPAEPNSDR